ncbi:uncharacterized protein LOC124377357, partial [Tachysurus ichikawai]
DQVCKSARAKHVASFRRFTYMILNSNITELERTLTYKRDGIDHVIYVSTNSMKGFGCGKTGHLVRACPVQRGGKTVHQVRADFRPWTGLSRNRLHRWKGRSGRLLRPRKERNRLAQRLR